MNPSKYVLWKLIKFGTLLLAISLFGLFLFHNLGFIINNTDSYPEGVYREISFKNDVVTYKGQLVTVCPKITDNKAIELYIANNYWHPGTRCFGKYASFMKKLVGIPGDEVKVTKQGVYINGSLLKNSKIRAESYAWLIFPENYQHTLQENEYWIMSDYNDTSFDSRYFGLIKKQEILGYVKSIYLF